IPTARNGISPVSELSTSSFRLLCHSKSLHKTCLVQCLWVATPSPASGLSSYTDFQRPAVWLSPPRSANLWHRRTLHIPVCILLSQHHVPFRPHGLNQPLLCILRRHFHQQCIHHPTPPPALIQLHTLEGLALQRDG